jgi:hypothetical protein
MLRLIRPTLVRRYSHTHSKTIFPENNNKVIEDLIKKQNETLKDINKQIGLVGLMISLLTITIAFKP